MVNIGNIDESLIKFDEVSKGIDKNKKHLSISQILNLIQEPFDSKGVAQKTHDKHFNNPESQYYQMSVEQIKEAWSIKGKESCKYGSLLDNYIGYCLKNDEDSLEMFKLDNNYDYDNRLHSLCDSFDDFMKLVTKSNDMKFVTREKMLYYDIPDKDYYLQGRFDALFFNERTNHYVIIDWKSSGSVDKKTSPWTKNLFGPMCLYPALNWYTYTLQTHFYKKCLLESGYLDKSVTEDMVDTLVVQLPGLILENKQNFEIHKQAFKYDSKMMDKLFDFAIRKNELLNK